MADEESNSEAQGERASDESETSEIEELLEVGYEQLDDFMGWLEMYRGLSAKLAQQDSFNAEAWIDYLANYERKTATEANEYDLRWFLFSHYLRKTLADQETALRLPISLANFYTYLQAEQGFAPPAWLRETLEDQGYYTQRREEFLALDEQDEESWQLGFRRWCEELDAELDMRGLLLPKDLGEGLRWGERMGWREAALWSEANRLWQEERALLLGRGYSLKETVERLLHTYALWLETPQARLEERTPVEVILEERRDAEEE
jgi:hypothetical protein